MHSRSSIKYRNISHSEEPESTSSKTNPASVHSEIKKSASASSAISVNRKQNKQVQFCLPARDRRKDSCSSNLATQSDDELYQAQSLRNGRSFNDGCLMADYAKYDRFDVPDGRKANRRSLTLPDNAGARYNAYRNSTSSLRDAKMMEERDVCEDIARELLRRRQGGQSGGRVMSAFDRRAADAWKRHSLQGVPGRHYASYKSTPALYTIQESPLLPTAAQLQLRHDFCMRDISTLVGCHLCHQPLFGKALQCSDCDYLCHIKCEMRVVKPCYGPAHLQGTIGGPRRLIMADGLSSSQSSLNRPRRAYQSSLKPRKPGVRDLREGSTEMELLYVTERILALTFPSHGSEAAYRNALKDMSHMLRTKHGSKYKIFNLSKKRNDLSRLNDEVSEFGWPEDLAPPLERMCALCKELELWLADDPQNVVILHSKGGRGRAGLVVATYMHYTNICASEDMALDRFAMRRFYDENVDEFAQPSQKRYVVYFSGLLSGSIRINSSAIYLQHVGVVGLPAVEPKGCNLFLRIYEKLVPVFTSGVYTQTSKDVHIRLDRPLQLRGDILMKCYHRRSDDEPPSGRECLFRCQFNTCALTLEPGEKLKFTREELDEAYCDTRFPDNSRLELTFSAKPEPLQNGALANGAGRVEKPSEGLIRWDSYENFEKVPEDEGQSPELDDSIESFKSSHDETPPNSKDQSVKEGGVKPLVGHDNSNNDYNLPVKANKLGNGDLVHDYIAKQLLNDHHQNDQSSFGIKNTTNKSNGHVQRGEQNENREQLVTNNSRSILEEKSGLENLPGRETDIISAREEQEDEVSEPGPLRPHPNDSTDSGISTSSGPPSAGSNVPIPALNGSAILIATTTHESTMFNNKVLNSRSHEPSPPVEKYSLQSDRRSTSKSPITVAKEQFNKLFGRPSPPVEHRAKLITTPPSTPSGPPRSDADHQVTSNNVTRRIFDQSPPDEITMETSVKANSIDNRPPGKNFNPPPTPPKPRKDESSLMSEVAAMTATDSHPPREPIDISYRPRPLSPPTKRATSPPRKGLTPPASPYPQGEGSLIDVDLVGGDRYDPASKAFAYVPTKALETHFKAPKKQTVLIPRYDPQDGVEAPEGPPPPHESSWLDSVEEKYRDTVALQEAQEARSAPPDVREAANFDGLSGYLENLDSAMTSPLGPLSAPPLTQPSFPESQPKGSFSANQFNNNNSKDKNNYNSNSNYNSGPMSSSAHAGSSKSAPTRQRKLSDIHDPELDALLDPSYYLSFSNPSPHGDPQSPSTSAQSKLPTSPNAQLNSSLNQRPSSALGATSRGYGASGELRNDPLPPHFARRPGTAMETQRGPSPLEYEFTAKNSETPSYEQGAEKPIYASLQQRDRLSPGVIATAISQQLPPQSYGGAGSGGQHASRYASASPFGAPTSKTMYEHRKAVVPPKQHHSDWNLMDTLDSLEAAYPQDRRPGYHNSTSLSTSAVAAGSGLGSSGPGSRSVDSTPSLSHHRRTLSTGGSGAGRLAGGTSSPGPSLLWNDMDPDDWLDNQLEKLRFRKENNDPDLQRRKVQEKRLLDELKHMNQEKSERRSIDEAAYSLEGYGSRTGSVEQVGGEPGYSSSTSLTRRAPSPRGPNVPPKPPTPIFRPPSVNFDNPYGVVTGKPPTPPPTRERSRTPPSPRRGSPSFERRHQQQHQQQHQLQQQQQPYDSIDYNEGREAAATLNELDRVLVDSSYIQTPETSWGTSSANPHTLPRDKAFGFEGLEASVTAPDSYDISTYSRQPASYQSQNVGSRGRQEPPSPAPGGGMDTPIYGSVRASPKPILKKPKTPEPSMLSDFRYIGSGTVSNAPLLNGGVFPREGLHRTGSIDSSHRPETPAFPVKRIETPLPYHPLLYQQEPSSASLPEPASFVYNHHQPNQAHNQQVVAPRATYQSHQHQAQAQTSLVRSPSPGSMYYGQSRRSSVTSMGEPMEIISHHPVFVKDTSKYWYKQNMSREETINILKDKSPGTFIIRDSNSFPGAFGLALKVDKPPPNVQAKPGDETELVRHFLIEPTANGVKLKGCSNEPVFGSLSALVYQHSITPLALPCRLVLPEYDPAITSESLNSASALLDQGAACNVIYIHSCDCEALTGPEAVRRTVSQALSLAGQKGLKPVSVHFKVSSAGITITDNTRQLFFRRHYPVLSVTFCGLDPDDRRWSQPIEGQPTTLVARIFGFVGRKMASRTENACHIFAELEPEQPATAIVNFVTKVMMQSGKR